MQTIDIYREGRDVTFRPTESRPAAVVAVPYDVTIDPAVDRAYLGDADDPTTWRASAVLLAARSKMFGFEVRHDRLNRGVPPPASGPAPAPRRGRSRRPASSSAASAASAASVAGPIDPGAPPAPWDDGYAPPAGSIHRYDPDHEGD